MAKQVYQCTLCGMIHKTMKDAEKCEGNHAVVEAIDYNYGDRKNHLPDKLSCKMSDGSTVVFYRELKIARGC